MTKTMVTVYYPNGELEVFEKDDPALVDALLYKYAKIGVVTDIPIEQQETKKWAEKTTNGK